MNKERDIPPKNGRRIGGTPESDPTPVPPPGELSYVDLALDLWCSADGAIVLLDEQEFAEYRAAGAFTPELVESAERGWTELRALAELGQLPWWP